jgi:hypothetical protein
VLLDERFADLHRGLPRLSQNVLTQRLRELPESGVVTRRRPPGAGLVYALTNCGRALEAVLLAPGRWGRRCRPHHRVCTIQSLVFDGQDLDEVIRSEDATADGDTAMLRRFIRAFNDHRAGPPKRS